MEHEALKRESLKIGEKIGDILSGIFTPEMIQGLLMAVIAKLFNCDPPKDGATAKMRVTKNYQGNGRYRRAFFARVARTVRQNASQDGNSLSDDQSHVVAKALLDHIRKEDSHSLNLVIQELRSE